MEDGEEIVRRGSVRAEGVLDERCWTCLACVSCGDVGLEIERVVVVS